MEITYTHYIMATINPQQIPILKDVDTIKTTVITNIVKMLSYRGWISKKDIGTIIKTLVTNHPDDGIYKIPLSLDLNDSELYIGEKAKSFVGTYVMVRLLNQKITGVNNNKSHEVGDFLSDHKKCHKIIVVESISEKAQNQVNKMPHTESFIESSLMLNLVEHECSPQYEILTNAKVNAFMVAYGIKRKQIPKLENIDPVARYLFIKKGQIVRILRNNEVTGLSIGYRVVIHKGISKI